ncbi:MAG TPA: substrate-binding domain-containing protein [Gemmatimonadales bacterium]|nr:substrate-binding domain-containing protein [Gemmatimonadales bacterium]
MKDLPAAPLLMALVLLAACSGREVSKRQLRVCADPNNLPFSSRREAGFENRLAELIAGDLGAELHYTWWAQRRGFFRNTLNAGLCDLVLGVPGDFELALPTRPFYRSTYVFVSRVGSGFDVDSLDDPVLRRARIGVHLVGDDYSNTPPAHALARRGLSDNVVGFSLYENYARPNPPSRIIEAVAQGDIDVAIVWGPFAGYFGPRSDVPLRIAPVQPERDGPDLPFVFDIAAGVRKGDTVLRREVQAVLDRRREDICRILASYGVPRTASRRAACVAPAKPLSAATTPR